MSDLGKKIAGAAALAALGGGITYYLYNQGRAVSSGTSSPSGKGGLSPPPSPKPEKRVLSIIYATATGTSELFGKAIATEAKLKGFGKVGLFGGDTYTALAQNASTGSDQEQDLVDSGAVPTSIFALKDETVALMLLSTTGEGDPTDDFAEFYRDLLTAAKSDEAKELKLLSGLKYSIFGLGDRQYKYFCEIAKKVDDSLLALGATRLAETALGDVQQNMEDHFDEWRESIWEVVGSACDVDLVAESDEPPKPEYEFKLRADLQPQASPFPSPPSALEPTQKNPMLATVASMTQLLQKPNLNAGADTRSTLSIELDIEKSAVTYQGGDHCGVFAPAARRIAEEYLQALQVPRDQWDVVCELGTSANVQARASKANILPGRVTLVDAMRWYVDLCGPPRKSALRTCAKYCTSNIEKKDFSTILGDNTLFRATVKEKDIRTVLDWFKLFPTAAQGISVGHFIEIMPKNNPRFYSIASDQLVHKKTVKMSVSLVNGGLCSEFFRSVEIGEKVPIFVRKSTFHLPLRAKDRPLIMVGPGTGLAPLIGFFHRREAWMKKNIELGQCILFFGCRRSDEDYLHKEELEAWRGTDKVITNLQLAFSREQEHKVYVQDLIRQEKETVHDLLVNKGANLYICGDAKRMAKDVEATLLNDVLMGVGGMSEEAATKFIERAEHGDRFLKDVWTS